MSERKDALKQQLIDSRMYWDTVLDMVGEDQWETQVYSDGLGWTVRQLACHVADADKGHNRQIMNIADGNDIIPEDFDIERYNARVTEKTAEKSGPQARAEMAESRTQLYAWLDEVDESKLDNKGRHASLQVISVSDIIGVLADHERHHAQDIEAVIVRKPEE